MCIATEELRRLLDERGVEWRGGLPTETMVEADGLDLLYVALPDGRVRAFIRNYLTPEQAIAATLGSGTCHYSPDDVGFMWWDENDVEHYEEYSASDECGSASCDKCGYTMMVGDDGWFDGWDEITERWEEDGSYHKGYVIRPRFKHCPNCGAKVVEE